MSDAAGSKPFFSGENDLHTAGFCVSDFSLDKSRLQCISGPNFLMSKEVTIRILKVLFGRNMHPFRRVDSRLKIKSSKFSNSKGNRGRLIGVSHCVVMGKYG